MWKILSESIEGTSHRLSGVACQDSTFATVFTATDQGVILVGADGAGSAKESRIGSELACRMMVQYAMEFLGSGHTVEEVDDAKLRGWIAQVHSTLNQEANRLSVAPRELACTLLFAVIGSTAAAFAQIGDGALIVFEEGVYRHIFWPDTGEYHNTTFFVTDGAYEAHIQCATIHREVTEVSLMTDGLQMLALDYAARAVHQSFFTDLFRTLRATDNHHDLIVPMRQWLDSETVNRRTDDDKSLILATRKSGGDGNAAV